MAPKAFGTGSSPPDGYRERSGKGCVTQPFFVSPLLPEGKGGVSRLSRDGVVILPKHSRVILKCRIVMFGSSPPDGYRERSGKGCIMQPFFVSPLLPQSGKEVAMLR